MKLNSKLLQRTARCSEIKTMKSHMPKTELPPSTQLRKAVFGSFPKLGSWFFLLLGSFFLYAPLNASAASFGTPVIVSVAPGPDVTDSLTAGYPVTWVSVQIQNGSYGTWTPSYSITIDGTTAALGTVTLSPYSTVTIYKLVSSAIVMTAGPHKMASMVSIDRVERYFTVYARPIVTFDAQGGTSPIPASKFATNYLSYGTLATTTLAGFNFGGWLSGPDGTGTQITSATVYNTTASQTLYAKWVPFTTHGTPCLWLDQYSLVTGGNYEAADAGDTDGDGYTAWQEYIAGTVPTNRASVFKALVTISNGLPGVAWTPDLGTGRVYTVEGRTNLTVGVWGTTNASSRFFRVKVGLP